MEIGLVGDGGGNAIRLEIDWKVRDTWKMREKRSISHGFEHYVKLSSLSFSSMEVKAQEKENNSGRHMGPGKGQCQKEHSYVPSFGEVYLALLRAIDRHVTYCVNVIDPGARLKGMVHFKLISQPTGPTLQQHMNTS